MFLQAHRLSPALRTVMLIVVLSAGGIPAVSAKDPVARVERFHGFDQAIILTRGDARAVLCPQVGGRVLEFQVNSRHALWLEEAEKHWEPGKPALSSAGRFDYGPELTVTPHPKTWSGEWTGEILGDGAARLTGPVEAAAGIQVVREFRLIEESGRAVRLSCQQKLINIDQTPREVCHWGRSFSPGGGICLIPLGDRPSRFPSKYAMYEDGATINVRNTDEKIRERGGFLEILAPPRKPKLGFDSYAGWLAYLMPNDTLFVKQFATDPDRVYNEAAGITVSVWYPTGSRIELEPIGPRERLAPGQSATFTEDWTLLSFPYPKSGEQVDLVQLRNAVTKATGAK